MESGSTAASSGAGSIRGRVTADGRPVAEATVMIVSSDQPHPDLAFLTDERGGYALLDLRPGTYVVRVEAPPHGGRERRVRVRAGEAAPADFDLGDAASP